jgi:hypothetical protein
MFVSSWTSFHVAMLQRLTTRCQEHSTTFRNYFCVAVSCG